MIRSQPLTGLSSPRSFANRGFESTQLSVVGLYLVTFVQIFKASSCFVLRRKAVTFNYTNSFLTEMYIKKLMKSKPPERICVNTKALSFRIGK